MNIAETTEVLALIQAYTNRTADKAVIKAWHELLKPYAQGDCLQAVQDHYRESKDWLMPVDIINRAKAYRAERLAKFHDHIILTPADEKAALEGGDYKEQIAALRNLAAEGSITPHQYDAYQSGHLALTDLNRKEIGR